MILTLLLVYLPYEHAGVSGIFQLPRLPLLAEGERVELIDRVACAMSPAPRRASELPAVWLIAPDSPRRGLMEAVIEGAARWGVGPDTNYPALVLDGTEPVGHALSQPLIAVGPGPFEVLPAPLALHLFDPSPEELWTAIIALAGGFSLSGQGVMSPEAQDESRSGRPLLHQETVLTVREMEVLERVARGLPNKGIAAELDISMSTVKFHLVNLITKLNAQNRAELVMEAAREGHLIV